MAVCIGACLLLNGVAFGQSNNGQNKNINVPVRIGVVPGLSTQGKKDTNTTSNFSLNILGGITGSVNGVELGYLFNIDKGNLQGVQHAGLFNITGGFVKGVQMAALFNAVKGKVTGIQHAGLANYAGKSVYGLQMAGLYNQTSGHLNGAQMAGIVNYTKQNVRGLQMAGIANINNGKTSGFQAAGLFNYTKHLKGLQLGLINIADTSDGFSIGLITIVRKGYHKITISSNEVLNANVAIKTGNAKLYNILLVGVNAGNDEKCFSYGYGIGHEIKLGKRFTVNPEITSQQLYLGNWHYTNVLNKLQIQAGVKLAPGIALFAGPSFAVYYSDQPAAEKGYKFKLPSNNYNTFELWNDNVTGWIGWTAGISFL
jgi:hypothetical protein